MKKRIMVLMIGGLVGCGSHAKVSKLPEPHKSMAADTVTLFKTARACQKSAGGNDIKFTEECAPQFENKTILLIVKKVQSGAAGGLTIDAEVPGDELSSVTCEVTLPADKEAQDPVLQRLSELQKNDFAVISVQSVDSMGTLSYSFKGCSLVERVPAPA